MPVPGFDDFLTGDPVYDPDGTEFAAHMNALLTRIGARRPELLTEDATAGIADLGKVYRLDGHSLTLDPASDLTDGWWVYAKGPGTVLPDSGDTLDGAADLVLDADSSALLVSDGDSTIFALRGGGGGAAPIEPEGEWDDGAEYAKLDVVSYEGSAYLSRVDANTGNQPDTSPTQWMLLAGKGADGARIFVQNDAPSTDHPEGSLWIDANHPDYTLFRLEGEPLDWVYTGVDLKGAPGTNGIDGTDPGIRYEFDAGSIDTDEDPGPGKFVFNHADPSLATEIAIDMQSAEAGNPSAQGIIERWGGSTSPVKGTLLIKEIGAPHKRIEVEVTAVSDETGFFKLAIQNGALAGSIDDEAAYSLQFIPTGNVGAAGAGAVDSVNGVTPVDGDVTLEAADIPVTPAGGIASENVQDALEELDGDIAAVASDLADHEARDDNPHGVTAAQIGVEAGADVTDAGNVTPVLNATSKNPPIDADRVYQGDSTNSFSVFYSTWTQVKAFLKTYFDTIYVLASAIMAAGEYLSAASGKVLTAAGVWADATLKTLSSSGNSTPINFANFINGELVLGENTTLANPSGEKVGQCGRIKVTATGSTRTVALHADYKPATGVEAFPISVLTTETVYIDYWIQAANVIEITSVQRRAT